MTLPRLTRDMVQTAMFIRPRRPDDHREFEQVLPRWTPLFVYADENGRDWVRWSIPLDMALQMGLDKGCQCCSHMEEVSEAPEHSYLVDTAWDETDWYLERLDA